MNDLIQELEHAIHSGSKDKRVDTLRRVTDLFLGSSDRLNSKQIDVFDDVLGRLIQNIEAKARADLSSEIAPVGNAPINLVRKLANDDDISVAGPVLTHSPRLSASDLVGIIQTKSQAHLLAVSGRKTIEETVTTALVEHGEHDVLMKLSNNPGARFTSETFSNLVTKAGDNDSLLAALGIRADLPLELLKDILGRASAMLRSKLSDMASPELRFSIRKLLSCLSGELEEKVVQRSQAEEAVFDLNRRGELRESSVLQFASRGERDKTIAAIALMNGTTFEIVRLALDSPQAEATFIPCKAIGLKWMTVLAIIKTKHDLSQEQESSLRHAFIALTQETAQRTWRFWQARNKLAS